MLSVCPTQDNQQTLEVEGERRVVKPSQLHAYLIDMHSVQGNEACNCIQHLQTFDPLLIKTLSMNCSTAFGKTLYELQHGFWENTPAKLFQLVEDLIRQLTLGKQTDFILLDFSITFNKFNHPKLLYKLSTFGINGETLNWIESFSLVALKMLYWMRSLQMRSQSPLGYPRGLYWARFSFFCTLTTLLKILIHKLGSLLMTPRFT